MKVYKEFEVVIMAAGKGSRMSELTARKPKCLLPIMNLPMVYFPLKMFENFGFEEAYLVVLEVDKIVVETALEKTDLRIRSNIITIPGDKDWGTADTLRYMHSYFTYDVIVVSCDLLTDLNLNDVLNLYREYDASITALYFTPTKIRDYLPPGRASKTSLEKDIIGFVGETNELAFIGCSSEFNENVQISNGLLERYKHICFRSDLQDSHLYVIKKSILNFLMLDSNKDKNTLKGEFIPYIVRKQASKCNKCAEATFDHNTKPLDNGIMVTSSDGNVIPNAACTLVELCKRSEYNMASHLMSSYNSTTDDLRRTNFINPVKCYTYLSTDINENQNQNIIVRVNTIYDYCLINKLASDKWRRLSGMSNIRNISTSAEIASSKVEKESCFIGCESKIHSDAIIKKSNIGARCLIRSNTRITNSIIMDQVVINEKCILENCIVCDNANINEGCSLKNCIIGSQFEVPSNSMHSKDILSELDELMEI